MRVDEILRVAHSHYVAGRLEPARDLYQQALDLSPRHPDALHGLGVVAHRAGHHDIAADLISKALKRARKVPAFHTSLGLARLAQGRFREARGSFRRALELERGFVDARHGLGCAYQMEGALGDAIKAYRRVLKVGPDHCEAHQNLGEALLATGDAATAVAHLETASRLYLERGRGPLAKALAITAIALAALGRNEEQRTLVDFDQLLQVSQTAPPAGHQSVGEFNDALARLVSDHPTLVRATAAHATRNGWHTGTLTGAGGPVMEAMEASIREAVDAYCEALAVGPDHPFRRSRPDRYRVESWAIKMDRTGHQVAHIHPSAWLSGVYYVRMPGIVGAEESGEQGWIVFGGGRDDLCHGARPATRSVRPREGMMALFPSYFWHRTIAFESDEARISLAFDIIPVTGSPI